MKSMKLAVLLLLAAPAIVSAQATGTITGVISDETGALMPAAAVEATNQATGQTRGATSGSDGFYTLPLLSPGLYRVNASGGFNVPHGRYKRPKIYDPARLRAAAEALQGVVIEEADFERACKRAKPGDAVYLDPPYLPVSKTASFSA